MNPTGPYFRADLSLIHDRGFGFHADRCAPGILALLEPIRQRDGLVLELGAGTGALTRYLVEAGHRVIASDASPAMLELAMAALPSGLDIQRIVLPDDPLPAADAIVSIGHVLSYLDDEAAIGRALTAAAAALRPGGLLAIDLCDLRYGEGRDATALGRADDEWAIIIGFSLPRPDRLVREITTFVGSSPDGTWRRDDERHENVLLDTSTVAGLLAQHGVEATVGTSFGTEQLPPGLVTIVGRRLLIEAAD